MTKLLRHCPQNNGASSENKENHTPAPPLFIQSWGVCCFLPVAQTASQHCMEGRRRGRVWKAL